MILTWSETEQFFDFLEQAKQAIRMRLNITEGIPTLAGQQAAWREIEAFRTRLQNALRREASNAGVRMFASQDFTKYEVDEIVAGMAAALENLP